jgi:hypothetical protein
MTINKVEYTITLDADEHFFIQKLVEAHERLCINNLDDYVEPIDLEDQGYRDCKIELESTSKLLRELKGAF